MISTIATFQQIYPSHVLIKLEFLDKDLTIQEKSLDQVDLNQLCIEPIKQWISKTIAHALPGQIELIEIGRAHV